MKTRWIVRLVCIGALVTVSIQWWFISQLRRELGDLRAEPRPEQSPGVPVTEALPTEVDQIRKDQAELLQLRNEMRQLRGERGASDTGRNEKTQQADPQDTGQEAELVRHLALEASAGDYTALDKLNVLSLAAHEMFKTKADASLDVFVEFRAAFETIGSEVNKGSPTALQALIRASRVDALQGFAVLALGNAAGQGNEAALEPLLDPNRYFLTQSTVVGALKPAADSGNVRAIQALANVAADPNAQALWSMTAQSLEAAAKAGNATAIDSLAMLVRSDNQDVRHTAFVALESAAVQHARAADALRSLRNK